MAKPSSMGNIDWRAIPNERANEIIDSGPYYVFDNKVVCWSHSEANGALVWLKKHATKKKYCSKMARENYSIYKSAPTLRVRPVSLFERLEQLY
jgi:hypothetical protein